MAGEKNSPDRSLVVATELDGVGLDPAGIDEGPLVHRGLTYPLGKRAPAQGELIELAPGVSWARLSMPMALDHINVWVLEDGEGVALVDTGLDTPQCRAGWEALFDGPLAGRTVTRVIVTHFHPDHIGLAGWLCRRFGVRLWMTRGEWGTARFITLDVSDTPPDEAVSQWRLAGWDDERIAIEKAKGWGRFAAICSTVPPSLVRLSDGDRLNIGGREWRIVTGNGHSPEHACLVQDELKVMIAGDQVLPRITSNVSLTHIEPDGDPLGDWLSSIAKLKGLPDDLLVLPAHGEVFTGLHARLDALDKGHNGRLDALVKRLAEPKRVVDIFPVLFGRAIQGDDLPPATGEAFAHLRRLELDGRAVREERDGVAWFRAA